ncbi:hypothetical protein [Micromonospora sp. WMMC250]|uniref:hypothetical protein n=1 Tax=Micromonospora sp. WMMC250 TaxID=3014781 RepID=UPI0022B6360E|nr:hypothetical protein [Micromonospora sp. WMMC250]MCZ7376564.1 hypothetical protein [Micromonospora sp. WMMC250]
MNLPDWAAWIPDALDVAQQNAQHVAVGAGIIGALIGARTIRRFTKDREHDEVATNLGVLLFLVVTTEGMWEVVRNKLGVPVPLAVAMFAAYDVVIYAQRASALKALAKDKNARIGLYLAIIWGMSIAASITVSFASGNAAVWFLRFFSPLVGAALATQKILAKRGDGAKRQESNWIWTPDRLLVKWGWKKPGAVDDLSEVFAQRRIAALVDAGLSLYAEQEAAKLHAGEPAKASRWRRREDPLVAARRRVQQLTKAATPEDVAAARKQLRLTLNIEQELFRPDEDLDERGRQTLDDVRLIMRDATERVRMVQPPAALVDQIRSNGLVQMRPEVADQIWTRAVDQHWSSGRTNGTDLSRTKPGAVDQPRTSGSVPAARATTERRSTARVDRARPVSPAAGGEVPPKVREMAKALAKKFRGEIPARAEVMRVMGWTSADYTGKAINLVRAERTTTTTKES